MTENEGMGKNKNGIGLKRTEKDMIFRDRTEYERPGHNSTEQVGAEL